ncbi:MAG: response regulator [Chloroflexi bacterium]|nr:response regulator [Chloroflexota bacterium]
MNKILVVDDIEDTRYAVGRILRHAGYAVLTAQDGTEARQQVETDPPDLILLDINMPGKDGFEICQELKASPETRDIPVVFLTAAYPDAQSKIRGLEQGADDYISQPFNNAELVARVGSILRSKERADASLREEIDAKAALLRSNALARLVKMLNASQSQQEVHSESLAQMLELLQAEAGALLLFRPEAERWELATSQGMLKPSAQGLARLAILQRLKPRPPGEPSKDSKSSEPNGHQEQRDVPQLAANGHTPAGPILERFSKAQNLPLVLRSSGTQGLLLLPLEDKGQLLGCFVILWRRNDPPPPQEEALLQEMGQQITITLERLKGVAQVREEATAEERNRLARELHDTIVQGLTGIIVQLEAVDHLFDRDRQRARGNLTKATTLSRRTLQDARRAIWGLRPENVERMPLEDAVGAEVNRLSENFEIKATLQVEGEAAVRPPLKPLPPDTVLALYRITQEALNNVRKHAMATEVEVRLIYRAQNVQLAIQDNGIGMKLDGSVHTSHGDKGGFGQIVMRERVNILDGQLFITSWPQAGTTVTVIIPRD